MGSIMIPAADTDVFVLAVHIFSQLKSMQNLWIEEKTSAGCTLTAVHDTCQKFTQQLCAILPVFHAVTGYDSVSAFYGYRKKKT